MKLYIIYSIMLSLMILSSLQCSDGQIVEEENRTTEKSILNYENTAKQLNEEVLRERYNIHIEVEEPYIVKFTKSRLPSIYRISNIQGVAIVKAKLDTQGNIVNHRIVRSAGLGLDEITQNLLKSMTFSPLYHTDKAVMSSIFIRIVYKEKN